MVQQTTLSKVKIDLRVTHNALDEDIADMIDACLSDLRICGIKDPDESDKAILAAIKLYCRAHYTVDTTLSQAYMERYNANKATLMVATGYGGNYD